MSHFLPTLHVPVDESGNFTFASRGSRFYVFGAAWTWDPEPLAPEIMRPSFSLLKQGVAAFAKGVSVFGVALLLSWGESAALRSILLVGRIV